MENLLSKNGLDFNNRESIKKFIKETESGMYAGQNVDGENVIVCVSKGEGMDVKTLQKNNWWVIHEYDENGFFVSETFDR